MLTYNTHRKKLKLPEYGRNLQQMVDHCLAIDDPERRNAAARAIVRTMATLFPQKREPGKENPDSSYWDILAIMSNFDPRIDWPPGTVSSEQMKQLPQPVPMTQGPMMFSIYGKNLQRMLEHAVDMPGGEEKDRLIMLIANQMKKQLTAINPETADDARVFKDIYAMTQGQIRMDTSMHRLYDYRIIQPAKKKRRR